MRTIFLSILAGVVLLAGGAWWVLQKNSYSKDIVKLEILGPEEAVAGEEISYSVRYKNNGNVRLEDPVLVFEYPKGSVPSNGAQTRMSKDLDALYPGQEGVADFAVKLLGKKDDLAQARAFLRYRPKNLSALYESETLFTTKITSIPIDLAVELPQGVQKGEQFEIVARMTSLFPDPLDDVVFRMEYPSGFIQLKADPVSLAPNEWRLGALSSGKETIIRVKGTMDGDPESTKEFRGILGTWKEGTFTELATVKQEIKLGKPSFSLFQVVNGEESPSVTPGETMRFQIIVHNDGEGALLRGTLEARLSGKAFDLESVRPVRGVFDKETQSILWGPDEESWLRSFQPGDDGRAEFTVNVKDPLPLTSPLDKNLTLKTAVSFDSVRRDFELKVRGKLSLSQTVSLTNDIFDNSATTYTIGWQIGSQTNDVSGVRVRATLPQGVEFTGKTYPMTSRVSFNATTREISWEAGVLKAGSGVFSKASSAAFQVGLAPTALQRGLVAPLIGQAKATGLDAFTLETVNASAPALDSPLSNATTTNDNQKNVQ